MSETTDDIMSGVICMECLQWLFGDNGEVCDCCHPVHCRDCFMEKSENERREAAQYFDPEVSRVLCYESRNTSSHRR